MKVFVFLIIFLLVGGGVQAEVSINRDFSEIALGTSIEDLNARHPLKEITGIELLPGERLFRAQGEFPGVERILCTFFLGKLFRIEVFYTPQYSQQIPWETFVKFLKKGYGEGWRFDSIKGQVAIWDDGETSFILERKASSGTPPAYVVKILDNDLFNAREETCPDQKLEV